ncbi:MAG: formate dehydrogenase subunit gamma [Rhodospirillaceae bacterium]|jgi:formate dehydrogenase subunit gamma|nr:formate dehydrogenase subunit gamma [Rhodospirillaceae bacterium]MBT4219563.1 formate dehydrogenase subunit gamma [Rhodospirillaceae bacterium]MBT4463890.1 formate dehydrogenase subunit gamma [Rhodospirillaceae bacterium]MBT5013362.1 formate dehydrogenase subunit gamma [Rhodospirillaceae bacterium]MBT5309764.1 formate dehydrogenase subunit gamma [Rhodospirillaceae bacterium]
MRCLLKHFGIVLLAVFVLSMAADVAVAQQQGMVPGQSAGAVNDSELWRSIRNGAEGLIQSEGDNWRALRNGPVSTWGGYLMGLMVFACIAFFLARGRVRVEHGMSGRMVSRFSMTERVVHWYVAVLFVLLALTGLTLLFGKYVFIPVFGKAAFAVLADLSKQSHNLLGPLFILGVIAMFIVYVKENMPRAIDMDWITKGGILFRGDVPSWKYNVAEKIWFWLAIIAGVALSFTGVFMDFPFISSGTEQLQLFSIIHAIGAVIVIAAAIGHIYIGTIGVEGAFDGMVTGEVDENWAKEHHSLWAEEEATPAASEGGAVEPAE